MTIPCSGRPLLALEVPGLSAGDLEAAGLRVATLLAGEPFFEAVGGRRKMTPRGTSLATDMPVIAGFGTGRLDPIFGSIGEAHGILRGQEDGRTWKKIYEFWRVRA